MACVGELSSIWLPQVQATVLATALPWLEKHYLKPIWLRFHIQTPYSSIGIGGVSPKLF